MRGKGGNDTLAGGLKSDTFVFEATLAENGVDRILDFQPRSAGKKDGKKEDKKGDYDILDLTAVFANKAKPGKLSEFVRVVDNKLQIDLDGAKGGGQWTDWAVLDGVKQDDRIAVKTKSGKGYIVVGGGEDNGVYLTVGKDGVWIDSNENGLRDGSETLASLTDASGGYYTVDGVSFADDDVTVRFVDARTPKPLDLSEIGRAHV